jgi:phage terminase small subunit
VPPLKSTREERFCLELASGCSLTEAARKAGYSPRSANNQGFLLSVKETIKARVKELQETMFSEKIANVIERKERLTEIIRTTENLKPNDVIAAIAELNKMEGSYAPTKVESRSQSLGIKEIIIRRIGTGKENDTPALP